MLSDLILELLPGLGLAGLVDQLAPDFGRDELHHKVAELVLPEGNAITVAIRALVCIPFFQRGCDIVGARGRAWVVNLNIQLVLSPPILQRLQSLWSDWVCVTLLRPCAEVLHGRADSDKVNTNRGFPLLTILVPNIVLVPRILAKLGLKEL